VKSMCNFAGHKQKQQVFVKL